MKMTEIKIGDLVKVKDVWQTHTTYPIEELTNDIDTIRRFCYSQLPCKNKKYRVIEIFPLNDSNDRCSLYLIQEKGLHVPIYIVGTSGLIKIGEGAENENDGNESGCDFRI